MKPISSAPLSRITRFISAWGLVLMLGPALLWTDRGLGSMFIALGLVNVFFNPLRPDDERARALRIKAIAVGFYASFGALFLVTVLLRSLSNEAVIRALRHEGHLPSVGYWDAVILTLLFAQGLFWFWRYRDGKEPTPVTGWRRVVQMCLTGR